MRVRTYIKLTVSLALDPVAGKDVLTQEHPITKMIVHKTKNMDFAEVIPGVLLTLRDPETKKGGDTPVAIALDLPSALRQLTWHIEDLQGKYLKVNAELDSIKEATTTLHGYKDTTKFAHAINILNEACNLAYAEEAKVLGELHDLIGPEAVSYLIRSEELINFKITSYDPETQTPKEDTDSEKR